MTITSYIPLSTKEFIIIFNYKDINETVLHTIAHLVVSYIFDKIVMRFVLWLTLNENRVTGNRFVLILLYPMYTQLRSK